MKKFIIYCSCFCFCCLFFNFSAKASDRFFSALYDVPVLNNLEELPELSYSYDKEGGSIAHVAAVIDGDNALFIYKAYERSLPQFGWNKIGEKSYYRDGEILTISHELIDKSLIFYFTLQPRQENR